MKSLAALALLLLLGCSPDGPECTSDILFGRPSAKTGLDDTQCQPRCSCRGSDWQAPLYGDPHIQAALRWTLIDPPAQLTSDPYTQTPVPDGPDTVCAFMPASSSSYRLITYESETAARAAGAFPSHFGGCGLCSPLTDLAVYLRHDDLTDPVRKCGIDHVGGPPEKHLECLEQLGFSHPCAQIWYYNTLHTRETCLLDCLANINSPYNLPDGTLNDCLLCDELMSGPIFKKIAGRTRRNTGIANTICRPCTEVRPLLHDYL